MTSAATSSIRLLALELSRPEDGRTARRRSNESPEAYFPGAQTFGLLFQNQALADDAFHNGYYRNRIAAGGDLFRPSPVAGRTGNKEGGC